MVMASPAVGGMKLPWLVSSDGSKNPDSHLHGERGHEPTRDMVVSSPTVPGMKLPWLVSSDCKKSLILCTRGSGKGDTSRQGTWSFRPQPWMG